jgi:hypothetical protein
MNERPDNQVPNEPTPNEGEGSLSDELAFKIDPEYVINKIGTQFDIAVYRSGFQHINETNPRRLEVEADAVSVMMSNGTYTGSEEDSVYIETLIDNMAYEEEKYIENLSELNIDLRIGLLKGELSEVEVFEQKARIYVEMISELTVAPDDPIVKLINSTLPGEPIEDNDTRLLLFFDEYQVRKNAEIAAHNKQVRDALEYIGVKQNMSAAQLDELTRHIGELLLDIRNIYNSTDELSTPIERELYVQSNTAHIEISSHQVYLLTAYVNSQY